MDEDQESRDRALREFEYIWPAILLVAGLIMTTVGALGVSDGIGAALTLGIMFVGLVITIPTTVISHPDQDHYKGLTPLFNSPQFRFESIYHSGLVERAGAAFGQVDRHARNQKGRGDHEDDQKHQHHVNERCHIDLRHRCAAAAAPARLAPMVEAEGP